MTDPTIIFRQSRLKLSLGLLGAGTFTALCVWVLYRPDFISDHSLAYVGLLFFGGGSILFFCSIIRPGSLTLEPSGLVWRTTFRTFRYDWRDIQGFVLWSPANLLLALRQPALIVAEHYRRDRPWWRITRGLGSFGNFWEASSAEMVDTLNAALKRWGAATEPDR